MTGPEAMRAGTGRSPGRFARHVQTIIAREVRSRYTGDRLGYLWTYATPLAWVAIVYFVFLFFGSRVPIDTDILSFILSGIIPYATFRYVINAFIRARMAFKQIIALGTTRPAAIYTAVGVVETYNGLFVSAGLLAFNYLFFGYFEMHDVLTALFGFAMAAGLGAAFGYMMVGLGTHSEAFPRSQGIVLRPMFYISGIFYIANELPLRVREILSWNPLFHAIETLREGMFAGYVSVMATPLVPFAWIAAMTSIGWVAKHGGLGRAAEGDDSAASEALM
ncbi:ABC transporter permease [Sphingomicrobium astaxanthinifaciens]|uniref:ABC transporter permease n=1 Tax=Sphingomicrobium astaxanthinifaciens TaxID=1227949 RepID=UPI001FCC1F89|nr:ABC transporter permease [Sphingomicrobium astaxanthinifaciens]MCJ7420790.1 ABC transporter permease [Sphingomicrobium astaxanthinifaciens]